MFAGLTDKEREELSRRYGLAFADGPVLPGAVRISDLLNPDVCAGYLDRFGEEIGSPSRRVSASMLAKRYAHVAVSPVLYAMTVYGKGLLLDARDCWLVSPSEERVAAGGSRFPDLAVTSLTVVVPEAGNRREWRERVVRGMFAEHLALLFRVLAAEGPAAPATLWENAAVRIGPVYEGRLEDAETAAEISRIQEDYEYVTLAGDGSLFGERRNPFVPCMNPATPGAPGPTRRRQRRTCCHYDEISSEYCLACPKVARNR